MTLDIIKRKLLRLIDQFGTVREYDLQLVVRDIEEYEVELNLPVSKGTYTLKRITCLNGAATHDVVMCCTAMTHQVDSERIYLYQASGKPILHLVINGAKQPSWLTYCPWCGEKIIIDP